MNYQAWHFTVKPPQPGSEIIIALLSEFPFESFDNTPSGFVAYVPEESASQIDISDFQFDDFSFTYQIEKIEQLNWNAEWEKNFEPVLVDDLLCIRAPFHEKNKTVKHEVVIMPKMSFGTGHHQTTRLVCQQLFTTDFKNKKVLDMGCGTGVLAILAAKLGATNVTGIDIDEWSVENAKENCATNGFADITILKGGVEVLAGLAQFDVLLANINKNILKQQLPVYSTHCNKGAQLFLSGFFVTDSEEMKQEASKNNFRFVQMQHENEWVAMQFEKI